ncbi:hypothetical protein P7C70_g576, partial [Phenoliferia sp. Uapishka_3]
MDATPPTRSISPASPRTIPDLAAAILLTFNEQGTFDERLRQSLQSVSITGGGQRLAEDTILGRRLIVRLLEAFHFSSLSRLPAFQHLGSILAPYELANTSLAIDTMEPSAQETFGTAPPSNLDDASIDEVAGVGAKRGRICSKLGDLAWDLTGRTGFFWDDPTVLGEVYSSQGNDMELRKLIVVLGWAEWRNLTSSQPVRALWALRTAVARFREMQVRTPSEPRTRSSQLRDVLELIMLALDAGISAKLLSDPIVLPPSSPEFAQTLSTSHLSDTLDSLSQSNSRSKGIVDHTLMVVTQHIIQAQGCFVRLCLGHQGLSRPVAVSSVHYLWTFVDSIHGAVQRLQHLLASTDSASEGSDCDERSLDVAILLTVRLDMQLIELFASLHAFLERLPHFGIPDLRAESLQRIRKCLKLVAFYAQFLLTSRDPYLTYHAFSHLEVLPSWIRLACERVGETPGPASQEFEVSLQELEWVDKALRTACLYSEAPAQRLRELVFERKARAAAAVVKQFPRRPASSTSRAVSYEYYLSPPSDDSPSLSLSSGETSSSGDIASPSPLQSYASQAFSLGGAFNHGEESSKVLPYNLEVNNPGAVSQDWPRRDLFEEWTHQDESNNGSGRTKHYDYL